MNTWLVGVRGAIVAAHVVALWGLLRRGRARLVRLLPVYLAITALVLLPRVVSPDVARSWDYWLVQELARLVLAAGVVLEIAVRVFAHLPAARRRAWSVLVAIVIGTAVAVWQAPGLTDGLRSTGWRFTLLLEVLPRLAVGSILLCVATLVAMAFHRIPLDALHGAVLCGMAVFLLVYAGPMGSADQHPFGRFVIYYVAPPAYLAMSVVWAVVAWQRETRLDVPRDVLLKVHPWRRSGS